MQNRIREIRLKKGMSQKDLADFIGITQAQVARIETGKRSFNFDFLPVLAKALGCKPYELLPLEWQPETISEADLQILRSIKSYAKDKENEEKVQNPQKQKENER